MKGMKKVFALVLVAIFAVGMLAACGKKEEPAPAPSEPTTKECPHCFSTINIKATKCPNCTSDLK